MPRYADVPCAAGCGTLMWRGHGSLPAGQATCRRCRSAARPGPIPPIPRVVPADCATDGCTKPTNAHGYCKNHYETWLRANDPEKLKAKWRAKNRRRRAAGRQHGISPKRELELRRKAKTCPICGVKLTDDPFLPNSKELDRIIPGAMGGTYTEGNVRVTCRACNGARPKDGSDYTGPVTLWAEQPGFVPRPRKTPKPKPPQRAPRIPKRDRTDDGIRAAQMRADGWQWRWIAERLDFKSDAEAKSNAERHGLPEDIDRWPVKRTTCYTCGAALPEQRGGRPRKYCKSCADAKLWYPLLYVTSRQ